MFSGINLDGMDMNLYDTDIDYNLIIAFLLDIDKYELTDETQEFISNLIDSKIEIVKELYGEYKTSNGILFNDTTGWVYLLEFDDVEVAINYAKHFNLDIDINNFFCMFNNQKLQYTQHCSISDTDFENKLYCINKNREEFKKEFDYIGDKLLTYKACIELNKIK